MDEAHYRKPKTDQTEGLGLFARVLLHEAEQETATLIDTKAQAADFAATLALCNTPKAKAQRIRDAEQSRWIIAGKPIALAVLKRDGKVTAATFRKEAELRKALPPSYDNQRALAYIPAMFAELVADGSLEKSRRADESVVKVYDPETRNEHVCYVAKRRAA